MAKKVIDMRSGIMATYKIAVIPDDRVGPEVLAEGIKVLKKIAERYGMN